MNGRRVGRWVQGTLIGVAGAVTILSVSAVLLSGYQAGDARNLAEQERRKAEIARLEYQSRRIGAPSSKEHFPSFGESGTDAASEHGAIVVDSPDFVVESVDQADEVSETTDAPHVTGADSLETRSEIRTDSRTVIAKASSPAKKTQPRIVAQGNAFGALALVLLALLGASLALALFHADPSTRKWIGVISAASVAGLAMAWRGILPPQYVGRSAIVALFVLMAFAFIDARRRGRYTWPVRVGVAAAFMAVCCVLSWYGRLV